MDHAAFHGVVGDTYQYQQHQNVPFHTIMFYWFSQQK
jgi:hypothetical protein